MKVTRTAISDVVLLAPEVYADIRGWFIEGWNQRALKLAGIDAQFVQENQSHSTRNVLRGLHYQLQRSQGKLIRVLSGEIFDVAVDLRRASTTFGQSITARLTGTEHQAIWIPQGFAHGFLVRSEAATVLYSVTDYWAPEFERTVAWNDPDLAIAWPLSNPPILSSKDASGVPFAMAEVYA
ncbi:MAG: dTDP-4-dehydrorhamnose 3,5-epimerase [Burkholderiales bacterium]